MSSDAGVLEGAAAAVREAQEGLYAARRRLIAAVVAAYEEKEPVARIAECTERTVIDVQNMFTAAGAFRGL
ncbi:hypothetical protein [Streptomyces sp. NPDC005498]|uniref:hypothetical protein n=1 Tax=Streptomyces sp. NPDC005498 TaxID=3364717 RepID=UPI00368BCF3F